MTSHRLVLVLLIVVCFGSVALAQNVVYTGCLKSADGSLYSVRAGTAPMSPCKAKDNQISWNMAGQPGPQGPPGPSLLPTLEVNVNCDEGQSVNEALAQQAERLTVSISGNCAQHVAITRDDVTLQGVGTNPTITAPAGSGETLEIRGAQRVVIQGFAVMGSPSAGIWAGEGASFSAHQLKISNSRGVGLDLQKGVTAYLGDSEISGNGGEGVKVYDGSSLYLSNVEIIDNAEKGVWAVCSTLTFQGTNVARNASGVWLRASHAEGRTGGNTILDNGGTGFFLEEGSGMFLEHSRVAGNGEEGLLVSGSSAASLADVIVQNNRNGGVVATGGSSVGVGGASTIEGGTEVSGILLRDSCTINGPPAEGSITGFPYGIECAGPPSVSQIAGSVPANLSTNCPHT